MSKCKIGLSECKYPNTCFKPCDTCVRRQLEDEIMAIKREAIEDERPKAFSKGYDSGYRQGRADAIEEMKTIVKELCFGFKASQGNLIRVDVVEECITKRLEKLKEKK